MNHHPGAIQEECMAKMELNRQEEYLNRIDRLKLMDDDLSLIHISEPTRRS